VDGVSYRADAITSSSSVRSVPVSREDRAFQIRWEEYKVIQDKIDRIGDFRFRLRSWMITLVAAAAAASRPAKLPPEVFILGFVVILTFYRLEAVQSRWERALGNRAGLLEAELRSSYGAPGIVNTLFFASRTARYRKILLADRGIFYGLMYLIAFVGLALTTDVSRMIEVFGAIITWAQFYFNGSKQS
jgi:hypothetical protein